MKRQMMKDMDSIDKRKGHVDQGKTDYKKVVGNEKEAYLQEVSQKTMFDEVYKNQIKIIEEKEKEQQQRR